MCPVVIHQFAGPLRGVASHRPGQRLPEMGIDLFHRDLEPQVGAEDMLERCRNQVVCVDQRSIQVEQNDREVRQNYTTPFIQQNST